MKKITKSLLLAFMAFATLTSCKQDDTLQYNNLTMGNVTNGTFVSDQGNIFNVVERNCSGDLESMDRAIILCDVLKKVEGTENEYDIRLNNLAQVLTKSPITKVEADASESTAVQDPIGIDQAWISGGYINMYVIYEVKSYSSTKNHIVNLVLDEKESSEGKYSFTLRHNSAGESIKYDKNIYLIAGSYVSFPISDLIKENSADIQISYEWYKSAGNGLSSETQVNSFNISYTKGGFEHVPSKLASKTTNKLN